jgi:hypothetical protein
MSNQTEKNNSTSSSSPSSSSSSSNEKNKGERVMEIVKAWKKLKEIGFPDETPALVEFKKITNQFIEDGVAVTGKIPMLEYDRMLCYILTNHRKKESTIALMATKK